MFQTLGASCVIVLFFDQIVKLHGLPKTIVSFRDIKFISYFWWILWRKIRAKLKFSMAFHLQTDGHTEIVNRTLENILRCLVGENLKTWDLILPMAEFVYNSSIDRTTGLSPFEIVTSFKPKQPIDLVPMARHNSRVSDSVSVFASHIRALHEKIRGKIMKNNSDYKASADLHCRLRIFNVRDYVIVHLRPFMVSSENYEEIAHTKHMTFLDPQKDQSKCLYGELPARYWH